MSRYECEDCGLAAMDLPDGFDAEFVFERGDDGVMRCQGCRRRPVPLPLHRTEAGYPRCATCDGGCCPDCTDPS